MTESMKHNFAVAKATNCGVHEPENSGGFGYSVLMCDAPPHRLFNPWENITQAIECADNVFWSWSLASSVYSDERRYGFTGRILGGGIYPATESKLQHAICRAIEATDAAKEESDTE